MGCHGKRGIALFGVLHPLHGNDRGCTEIPVFWLAGFIEEADSMPVIFAPGRGESALLPDEAGHSVIGTVGKNPHKYKLLFTRSASVGSDFWA